LNLKIQIIFLILINPNSQPIKICRVLSKFGTFERIEFAQNGINEEGFNSFFPSLKDNLNLRIINLEDNTIKNSSKLLIEILPDLKKLQSLIINDSLLTEKNSVNLFEAVKNLENLKIIQCNYNEIENIKSQKKIFQVLLENKEKLKNLKKVTLKGNEIDKDLFKEYSQKLDNIDEFEAYSDEELEADLYDELEEDEFGNKRMEKMKIID